ncbi:MAG: hypothetical protein WDW38_003151 [Sanguina aurantia]
MQRLTDASPVFRCPKLLHAGLSYNQLTRLPSPLNHAPNNATLISLDLSHNDICDLPALLTRLASLPALRSLDLQGNPFCLAPSYLSDTQATLPHLAFLDGKHIGLIGSRPPTTSIPLSDAEVAAVGWDTSSAERAPATFLELYLHSITPTEDHYQSVREAWEDTLAVAEVAGVPPVFKTPEPPLQPVRYYFEMEDPGGALLCSIPLSISPPSPPEPPAPLDGGGKGGKGGKGKAVSPKAGPGRGDDKAVGKGKAGTPAEPPSALPTLEAGSLKARLPLFLDTTSRDFLRNGMKVTMFQMVSTAEARPGTLPREPVTPSKGVKPTLPKAGVAEVPVMQYEISSVVTLMGTGMLHCARDLLDGCTFSCTELLQIKPAPGLWDSRGLRMPLKDARHETDTVATLTAEIRIHVASVVAGIRKT